MLLLLPLCHQCVSIISPIFHMFWPIPISGSIQFNNFSRKSILIWHNFFTYCPNYWSLGWPKSQKKWLLLHLCQCVSPSFSQYFKCLDIYWCQVLFNNATRKCQHFIGKESWCRVVPWPVQYYWNSKGNSWNVHHLPAKEEEASA